MIMHLLPYLALPIYLLKKIVKFVQWQNCRTLVMYRMEQVFNFYKAVLSSLVNIVKLKMIGLFVDALQDST